MLWQVLQPHQCLACFWTSPYELVTNPDDVGTTGNSFFASAASSSSIVPCDRFHFITSSVPLKSWIGRDLAWKLTVIGIMDGYVWQIYFSAVSLLSFFKVFELDLHLGGLALWSYCILCFTTSWLPTEINFSSSFFSPYFNRFFQHCCMTSNCYWKYSCMSILFRSLHLKICHVNVSISVYSISFL